VDPQVVELAAEQERDALEGGAQQVLALVGQGQADPGAPGAAVIPALTDQVGQEDGGIRRPGAPGGIVELLPAGTERAPHPVEGHADILGPSQPVDPAVHGPEQVDRATRIWIVRDRRARIWTVRKWNIRAGGDQLAAGAEGEEAASGREVSGEQGGGGVGGADRDREAGGKAEVFRGLGEKGAGDPGRRADGGQEVGAQPEGQGDVRGPFAARQVEQQRA
jgi:hypothetical protein